MCILVRPSNQSLSEQQIVYTDTHTRTRILMRSSRMAVGRKMTCSQHSNTHIHACCRGTAQADIQIVHLISSIEKFQGLSKIIGLYVRVTRYFILLYFFSVQTKI